MYPSESAAMDALAPSNTTSTITTTTTKAVLTAPSVSPLRKRGRAELSQSRKKTTTTTKLSSPPPRRLRARIDHTQRVWSGRCGCNGPNCMAHEFEFSSDTQASSSSSDTSDSDDDTSDCHRRLRKQEQDPDGEERATSEPQDPSDLLPMMLHLMLMM